MGIKASEIAFLLPLLLGGGLGVAGLFNQPQPQGQPGATPKPPTTGGAEPPKPDQGGVPSLVGTPMPDTSAPAVAATVGGRHVLPPVDIMAPGGQRPQMTAEGPPMPVYPRDIGLATSAPAPAQPLIPPTSPGLMDNFASLADPFIKMLGGDLASRGVATKPKMEDLSGTAIAQRALASKLNPALGVAGILGRGLGAAGGGAQMAEAMLPKILSAGLPRSAGAIGASALPRSPNAIQAAVDARAAAAPTGRFANIGTDIPSMASSTFKTAEEPFIAELARRAAAARATGVPAGAGPIRTSIANRFPNLPDFTEADYLASLRPRGMLGGR